MFRLELFLKDTLLRATETEIILDEVFKTLFNIFLQQNRSGEGVENKLMLLVSYIAG